MPVITRISAAKQLRDDAERLARELGLDSVTLAALDPSSTNHDYANQAQPTRAG
jgi:hypothetical protein